MSEITRSNATNSVEKRRLDTVAAAVELGSLGFEVFPLHGITPSGHCTCKIKTCSTPGAHPIIVDWRWRAASDEATIRTLWMQHLDANVGIALGSGLMVIDIDDPDGEAALAGYDLPETLTATTSWGRQLYYFGYCAEGITVLPGVVARGSGGYAVAPSLRFSRNRNHWDVAGVVDAPDWLKLLVLRQTLAGLRDRTMTPAGSLR